MDLKIKVCHFTTVHPIDDVRIFTKECVSLANNGFDVTLIACGDIAFEDIKNGVKRISLNVPVKNRFQRYFKRSKAVYRKALVVDADIYHFHDPELLTIELLIKKMTKAKLIYDAHEFESYKNVKAKLLSKVALYIETHIQTIECCKINHFIVSNAVRLKIEKYI